MFKHLYELPHSSVIQILDDDGFILELTVQRTDGMYSRCTNAQGQIALLYSMMRFEQAGEVWRSVDE